MARPIECKCEDNFTCGYCLRNAKPYRYTLSLCIVRPSKCPDDEHDREHDARVRDAKESYHD